MAAEIDPVIRAAKAQGITLEQTARHRRFVFPNGDTYVFPTTASDRRAVKNLVADLRNLGFIWPAPSKKELRSRRNKDQNPGQDQG